MTEQYHIDALKKESGNNHGNADLNHIDGYFESVVAFSPDSF